MAGATTRLTAKRIQYRVGHGGFHATFVNPSAPSLDDRLTYVYDVGAKPHKALLLSAIDDFSAGVASYGISRVDYIFLSHIDEDHVNGLVELLDALKRHVPQITVLNVVLPWLSPVQKLLTQARNNHRQEGTAVTNLVSSDEEADNFLERLGVGNVIRVTAEGDGAGTTGSVRTQGKPLAHSLSAWTLLPIKMPTPPGFEAAFKTELDRLISGAKLDPNDTKDHAKIIAKHRPSIRKAMNKVAGLVNVLPAHITNWSSLALLHGADLPSPACTVATPANHADIDCTHGWLHTGDLPLKEAAVWANLKSKLTKAKLGTPLCAVAAPHHGSQNDHEDDLYAYTTPGTVFLNAGRKLSGVNKGTPSYNYNLPIVIASATHHRANPIELDNP
ncbi:hypothetical protein G3N30_03860 [Microbacterium lacticum]|uniref:MBL fold metallo-hydrolase n=1 Tax=Microbacterium lacticum TaxID=33885 RepID=UPI0018B0C63C|nr:MBL fold metallo-hydrolase [Microbacterium lacticum]MBF9335400.1 hypothetical protein [Microbacterium lacticum]